MVLDCHTHVFPPEFCAQRRDFFEGEPDFELLYGDARSALVGAEDLVGYLRREGLDGACAFGFPWRNLELARRCNDYVLEAGDRFPGVVLPFACVHPLGGREALREAERSLAKGARGLGEIATYGDGLGEPVRRALAPFAELCREAGVPLLLHTNEPVGHAYPGKSRIDLGELYELIRSHPETTWILAHWGGGLFAYEWMKKEVADVLRNTYFDTAAGPYLYRPGIYRAFFDVSGRERLLFGSDFPLLGLGRYRQDLDAAGLPEEERRALLGENLARLLRWGGPR